MATISDETASLYYAELDTATGPDLEARRKALQEWANAKEVEQESAQWDHLTRVYGDFDNYIKSEGYADLDEESRYRVANRQFIAWQLRETPEEQATIYPTRREIYNQQTFGKKNLSEAETFNLIRDSVAARKATEDAISEIPADIALGLFNTIGTGTKVEVPHLVTAWKERNADKLKNLPEGWETKLLQSASSYAAETEGMLREHAESLKKVYDHLAAVTGRETAQAGESNPKNLQEMEALADTLASMPAEVRNRAYAAVVLGAKQAGQEPKEFLEQWGESWSRTLNMFRSGSMFMQEDAAFSRLKLLKEAPKLWQDTETGELTPYPGLDRSYLKEIDTEERARLTSEAQKKFDRLQVYRELYNIADNQFDPVKKINEGGFGGFMEAMAYGSPQALAYTGMALVPGVGPWLTGAAIYSEEYNQLRLQGIDPEAARMVAAPSAVIQAGLERVGAKLIFGKLPQFEKLMARIGNPARVGRVGSAGIRLGGAVVGENLVEGAQDLVTPLVQDAAEALGADVPDVKWQPILDQWAGSRLDVLAATIPGILIGTGVVTLAEGKRFDDFNERLDLYRSYGLDYAAIKRIEDNQTQKDRQAALQVEYKNLTPENIKAGISYMESKIDEAQSMQQNPNTPTLTREQPQGGNPVFVVRDEKGAVAYRSEDEQAAMSAITQLFKGQLLNERNVVVDLRNQWLSEDPTNVAIEAEALTAQQKLEKLQAAGNVAQIEELHRRIANSPYRDTPYDQINILGEATVEDLGEMVFRSVITYNKNTRPEDFREEMHHVAVRKALMKGWVTLDTLRGWLDATETALPDKFPSLVRESENDIVESLARVQRAYEDSKINADEEMSLPASFVDYIKRMLKVFKEVLQRAVALRGAFKQGILPGDYEAFLAESVGLNQQAMVDTTRERVANEVLADTNFSIGIAPNGKPSNLDPEEQSLVRSPEFMQWGGEWEVLAEDAAWKKTVEDYYSNPNQRKPLRIGRVPSVLRAVGVSNAPMVMPPSVIQKVTVKKHTLTREMVEQIPSALRDPIFVFNSATEPNSVTILTDIRHQGKNVVAAIHLDRPAPRKPANLVVSLHDRPASQIENWIKDGLILYANQGKARAYFRSARLQLPREGSKAGNKKLRTEADVVNRSVNPESVTVKTDENGEPLVSEIARFRQETGTSNFSIASQREIDRVNRALGGMNRGPDERLKVYERAKQRFSRLMAWNSDELAAMAETGSDETQIRRNQLLQGFGELDAILQILPPEVRGRVGGYTVLANIAPMDVFKDGVKISEVGGMKGALISAWMDQGLNIGQAGKKVDFPPGYTAKENLSSKRADKALADFFRDRIKKIDTELEKVLARDYRSAIEKLLEKALPKKSKAGVLTSTLGPEAAAFVKKAYAASLLDQDAATDRLQEIQGRLEEETDQKKVQELAEEWAVVNLFGAIDSSHSTKLASALDVLKSTIKAGRQKWKIQQDARREEIKKMVQTGLDTLGEFTSEQANLKTKQERQSALRNLKDSYNRSLAPYQLLETIFGAEHPITVQFNRKMREATNDKNLRDIEARRKFEDAARVALGFQPGERGMKVRWAIDKALLGLLEDKKGVKAFSGRKVKAVRIPVEIAEKVVRGEINLKSAQNMALDEFEEGIVTMTGSQMPRLTDAHIEAIRQELASYNERLAEADSERFAEDPNATPARRQKYISIDLVVKEGVLGERTMNAWEAMQYLATWNQPDGRAHMERNGFTEESVKQMQQLASSPFAKALYNEILKFYADNYSDHNRVFVNLYGVDMPKNINHSPLRFETQEKEQGGMRLPGERTGSGGMMPGHIKSRTKHQAELAQANMAEVFWNHVENGNYWIAWAESVRDMRAVLLNPKLLQSVTAVYGEDAATQIRDMVTLFTDGGVQMKNRAYERIYNNIVSAVSTASLGFRLSSIVNQNDAALRFMLKLSPKQQSRALVSLMQGNFVEKYKRALQSDTVQIRLAKGVSPLVRMMVENSNLPANTQLPDIIKKFLPEKLAQSATGGMQNFMLAVHMLREQGFMPMQLTDTALTSFSAAVVYESAFLEAKDAGMPDAAAEQAALDAMDDAVFRTAQPVDMAQRSMTENMALTWQRGLMQFMSDQRLKFSMWGSALRGLAKGEGDRTQHLQTLVVLGFMGIVSETLRAWYRDFFTDDDDEEIYKPSNWIRAFLVGPLTGFWWYGTILDTMLRGFLGERTFGMAGQLDAFLKDIERISRNPEPLYDWSDESRSLGAWKAAARVAGGLYAPAQVISLPLNIVEPVLGASENIQAEE